MKSRELVLLGSLANGKEIIPLSRIFLKRGILLCCDQIKEK
jgi:hypothetical protein